METVQVWATHCDLCEKWNLHGHAGPHRLEAARCHQEHLLSAHRAQVDFQGDLHIRMRLVEISLKEYDSWFTGRHSKESR